MDMITTFQTEEQMMQTECCFDIAMQRVNKKFGDDIKKLPEEGMESFRTKLWNNIALSVTKSGYAEAMDYARNANFVL